MEKPEKNYSSSHGSDSGSSDDDDDDMDSDERELKPYRPELENITSQKILMFVPPPNSPTHPKTVYFLHDPEINEGLIKHVEDRLGHDRRYGIDPSKIKADLGWYPETTFEVGIVKTIDWYLDNQQWMERVTSGEYQKYYEEMYKNR